MRLLLACVVVIGGSGCSEPAKKTVVASPPPSGSDAPYRGPPHQGPCIEARDCVLHDVCGCECTAVLASTKWGEDCDEACNNKNVCAGYSLICDLVAHRCGAIPPAP